MRKLSVLLALLLLAPAISQAKSLEDLLVEKGVITRGEAAGTSVVNASKVYWDAGTRTEFADTGFTAGWATYIQTGYAFYDTDESTGSDNRSSFEVRKARVILSGTVLHKEFSYFLQADFVGDKSASGSSSPALLDAYLTWHACDWAEVKVGQFKTGISRQFNVPDEKLQFATRTVTSDLFDLGRQQGLKADWKFADDRVVLSTAVFNGITDGEGINGVGLDTRHQGEIGLRADVLGKQDVFAEGDIDQTDELALNLGALVSYGQSTNSGTDFDTTDASVEVNLKYSGFSANAEYFYKNGNPDGGSNIKPQGFYLQAGYFVDPKTWEIAARYSWVDCDEDAAWGWSGTSEYGVNCSGNDSIDQLSLGVNYYWWKHYLKAQLAWDWISEDPASGDTMNSNVWSLFFTGYF